VIVAADDEDDDDNTSGAVDNDKPFVSVSRLAVSSNLSLLVAFVEVSCLKFVKFRTISSNFHSMHVLFFFFFP
jgi:hypothetical protein